MQILWAGSMCRAPSKHQTVRRLLSGQPIPGFHLRWRYFLLDVIAGAILGGGGLKLAEGIAGAFHSELQEFRA